MASALWILLIVGIVLLAIFFFGGRAAARRGGLREPPIDGSGRETKPSQQPYMPDEHGR